MKQKFTVLFDLDGTLVDTAPDLMLAHNHVMKKFGYPTKSLDELKSAVGQGAGAMIGRSIWSQAKKELTSITVKSVPGTKHVIPRAQNRRRRNSRIMIRQRAVSYTHLRAHETDSYLVCRLLLEKKK